MLALIITGANSIFLFWTASLKMGQSLKTRATLGLQLSILNGLEKLRSSSPMYILAYDVGLGSEYEIDVASFKVQPLLLSVE